MLTPEEPLAKELEALLEGNASIHWLSPLRFEVQEEKLEALIRHLKSSGCRALGFTSPRAVRFAAPALIEEAVEVGSLRVYTTGPATFREASRFFSNVIAPPGGGVQALIREAIRRGEECLVLVRSSEAPPAPISSGITVAEFHVYRPIPDEEAVKPACLGDFDVVALTSSSIARLYLEVCGCDPGKAIAAIGPPTARTVLERCWKPLTVAGKPGRSELAAAIKAACVMSRP